MQYLALYRILDDKEKFWGIQCLNEKSKLVSLNTKELDKLISNKEVNIEKRGSSLYITGTQQRIDELPIKYLDGIYGSDKFIRIYKSEFTGKKLEKYINNQVYSKDSSRLELVQHFIDNAKGGLNVVYITGLKGTGKSTLGYAVINTLLRHEILNEDVLLIQYSNLVYNKEEMDILKDKINNCVQKYIIIDEVTLIPGFVDSIESLLQVASALGKKLILISSDSLVLSFAQWEGYLRLYNHCISTVTIYKDWIINKGKAIGNVKDKQNIIKQYIMDCTLSSNGEYCNNKAMYDYISGSLCDSILDSFNKNNTTYECMIMDMGRMDREKLLYIFYKVCYDIVYKNMLSGYRSFRVNTALCNGLYELGIDREDLYNGLLKSLGIGEQYIRQKVTQSEYNSMVIIMAEAGIIKYITEFEFSRVYIEDEGEDGCEEDDEWEETTNGYITIPSIYHRFIQSILEICGFKSIKHINKIDNKFINLYDAVLESIVLTQIDEYIQIGRKCSDSGLERISITMEQINDDLDIVYMDKRTISVIVGSDKKAGLKGCAYRVTTDNKLDGKYFSGFGRWFKEAYGHMLDMKNIGIIYMGETTTYKDMKAINIYDFLMDIGRYI